MLKKMFGWLYHPMLSDGTINEWLGGVLVLLIIAFLWSTTIDLIREA